MDEGSRVCQRCGLCCDGTLFVRTPIGTGEAPAVSALGLTLDITDNETSIRQPCPMHRQGVCGVYASRPAACRTYRCGVLKTYELGTLSIEESEQRVDRARALRELVVAGLPPGDTLADMRRALSEEWDSGSGAFGSPAARSANAERLLSFGTLRRYLQKHFDPAQ